MPPARDAVRRLVADARARGPGQNYLIQHSAGSGKSLTLRPDPSADEALAFDMEIEHLRAAADLMTQYEKKDAAEVLPNEFPKASSRPARGRSRL